MPIPDKPCSFRSTTLRLCVIGSVLLGAAAVPPTGALQAAQENAILSITKNALYGGAAGMLLGGVTALVVHEGSRDDAIRWGIVLGTFGGFAYGIYDQSRHPSEYSLRFGAEERPPSAAVRNGLAAFRNEGTALRPAALRPGCGARILGVDSASPFPPASSLGACRRATW
jgi:hypothetical protein